MNDELYHYGVLGMKWGVRRYQNRDGTLTSAGKKRKRSESPASKVKQSNDTKAKGSSGAKSGTSSSEAKPKIKSAREMSDEELNAVVMRLRREKDYQDLVKALTPDQRGKAQKFVDSTLNDVIKPGIKEGAKNALAEVAKQEGKKFVSSVIETIAKQSDTSKKKLSKASESIKKMTDDELLDKTNRLQKESNYLNILEKVINYS